MKRKPLLTPSNAIFACRLAALRFLFGLWLLFSWDSNAADNPPNGSSAQASGEVRDSSSSNKVRAAVSDAVAAEMEIAALGNALTNHLQEMTKRAAAVETSFSHHEGVLITFTMLLILMLLILRFGRRIMNHMLDGRNQPWGGANAAAAAVAPTLAAEQQAFAAFAASFRIGPKASECNVQSQPDPILPAEKPATNRPEPIVRRRLPREFLASAPNRIARCRSLLQEITRATAELVRQTIAIELSGQVQLLKEDASHPDLVPIWQVTSSLEGLLKQLAEKPATVNPSTLRTIAGSIDLLDRLCAAGSNADLLKTPPVRFLAVDDDPVSRHTISFALKRALNAPDLAENGAAGLALAGENPYDVIFLDVQMPGMDGFELCKKIRSSQINQATPVVFVTCQSDFNSRAQSSLAGGCDLIGKPFLTFEITAKALLLALGNRLNKLKPSDAKAA